MAVLNASWAGAPPGPPAERGQEPEGGPSFPESADVPLVVDLDGTLIRTDMLAESVMLLARAHPLQLLWLPWWLRRGRAALKAALAQRVMPDVPTLPFEPELLEYLRSQKQVGRRLVLATGADARQAQAVAAAVGLFDDVLASDGDDNLSGEHKRRALVRVFGERGYDYVGSGARDLPVWRSARRALVVAPDTRLQAALERTTPIERVFVSGRDGPQAWLHAMRPHHWLKNLLLYVPLLAAHRLADLAALRDTTIACVAFCCAASATYLLNDLLDLPSDRRHPRKRLRALASGRIPLAGGAALAAALWLAAIAAGAALPGGYLAALGAYAALMCAYCLRLKDVMLVDAFVLALGYMLRIVAGGFAARVAVSPWLLVASALLFFSLALLKRQAELVALHPDRADPAARVRAYRVADIGSVAVLGGACAALAIAVLIAYPAADRAAGITRAPVWLVCALLAAWLARMWLMAYRGRIRDDPVSFALKDRPSCVLGLLTLAVLMEAT